MVNMIIVTQNRLASADEGSPRASCTPSRYQQDTKSCQPMLAMEGNPFSCIGSDTSC